MRREELRVARKYMDEAVIMMMAELKEDAVNCQTKIGPDKICGHSITSHEGDESGMGAPEPCNRCGCGNFTCEIVKDGDALQEAKRRKYDPTYTNPVAKSADEELRGSTERGWRQENTFMLVLPSGFIETRVITTFHPKESQ